MNIGKQKLCCFKLLREYFVPTLDLSGSIVQWNLTKTISELKPLKTASSDGFTFKWTAEIRPHFGSPLGGLDCKVFTVYVVLGFSGISIALGWPLVSSGDFSGALGWLLWCPRVTSLVPSGDFSGALRWLLWCPQVTSLVPSGDFSGDFSGVLGWLLSWTWLLIVYHEVYKCYKLLFQVCWHTLASNCKNRNQRKLRQASRMPPNFMPRILSMVQHGTIEIKDTDSALVHILCGCTYVRKIGQY